MPIVTENERMKLQKLIELGEAAHLLLRTGRLADPGMEEISEQIVTLDKEINAALGKRPPHRGDGRCPNCGAPHNNAVFCGSCGQNIDEFYSKPIPFCAVCGLMVEEDAEFCGICGSKREE